MITVPIRTVPGLNAREHWKARSRRVAKERKAVAETLFLQHQVRPAIPCTVRLTRISPGPGCDDDNLAGALKSVRDQVAQWLGVDDRHQQQVRYLYAQKRGPWGVGIEFGEPQPGAQFQLLDQATVRDARQLAEVPF